MTSSLNIDYRRRHCLCIATSKSSVLYTSIWRIQSHRIAFSTYALLTLLLIGLSAYYLPPRYPGTEKHLTNICAELIGPFLSALI
ncbi:hypothetical protein K440DRAFT_192112 [Wilcoxina mikolae CBS 423.85]|nr:hypothetical protein K440DRAFT_192112 [Wilcoxina mikolae CBS 423.85]